MKAKKLAVSIVTAATLLAGMALGAASAHAEDTMVTDKATFTLEISDPRQLLGRAYSIHKIGDYIKHGNGDTAKYSVRTSPANKKAVDTVLGEVLGDEYGKSTVDNLAKALADGKLDQSPDHPWTAGTTRKFADGLEKNSGMLTKSVLHTVKKDVENTFQDEAGIYFIHDTSVDPSTIVTPAVPMIVASGKIVNGELTEPTASATVKFKNSLIESNTKTVKQQTASLGEVLDYTLKGKVASPVPTSFEFVDQPGNGLSIKTDSFTATADGKDIAFKDYFTANFSLLKNGTDGDGKAVFTVTMKPEKIAELAGKAVDVSYKALINEQARNKDEVVNKVRGNDNEFFAVTTKLLKVEFTKIDADGNGIEGATFKISVGPSQTGSLPEKGGPSVESTSRRDGKVTFSGLKAGTYLITETKVAHGNYLDIKTSFTLMLSENGKATFSTIGLDPFKLVDTKRHTVLNVRSITQLPLTGAAGTFMFTVVALLLGAAGAAVVIKSRSVKNTMAA